MKKRHRSKTARIYAQLSMLAGLLLVVPGAHAQTTIDVAKITCRQFILLKVADPDKIALWLSGYFHAKRGTTTIDVQLLKEQPENVKRYCLYKDKDATVMEAVERLLAPSN